MPFVRFSRDRRGYEHIYLVDVHHQRGRPAESRILYWFRTPPGVKIGREPFDADLQRALEAKYPDVAFDWTRIVNTPMPPADVEHWRERRKAERAAKRMASAEPAEAVERDSGSAQLPPSGGAPDTSVEAAPGRRARRRGRRRRGQQPNAEARSSAEGSTALDVQITEAEEPEPG